MKFYENKLAFITGGSEGIGKETAKELVRLGAHAIIFSRSQSKLTSALKEIEMHRKTPEQKIAAIPVDVTQEKQAVEILGQAVAKYGTPDLVINCAGMARPGYFLDLETEQLRQMMDLNYFGIVHVCKALVPSLVKSRKGIIVNTSSIAGFIGLFGYTGYCASKYAVVGFSEALRRELVPYHVKVSVLCPPNTRTPGLVEENKYKPAEVLKTEEKAKPVDPDVVARALLKAIPKNHFFIIPTFDGKLARSLSRFMPGVLNLFVRRPATAKTENL